jgi:hypothetical protein
MDMCVNLFKGASSFHPIGGCVIYDAALLERTGSIQTFSQTSFRTDIRSVVGCRAKHRENAAKNAGRTLSERAPSK